MAQSSLKAVLQAFGNRRTAAVLLLGFSSGIPLALTANTLQAWMKDLSIDIKVIGLFSLVGLPYGWKFLWAPLMDRFAPPLLGRRRGWMFVSQLGLVASIAALGFSDPGSSLTLTALLAVLVAFFSASQDIVVDAYRTEVLRPEERGTGSAAYVAGYRVAMLVSGALAFVLADQKDGLGLSWSAVYLIMAATMSVGLVATWFAPEPEQRIEIPKTLQDAVVQPFVEFFRRPGALEILLFIFLYRITEVVATALTTPFLMELSFSKTEIAGVVKTFGLFATLTGAALGGGMMVKLGMYRSLFVFGILQGVSNLVYMALAQIGYDKTMLTVAIAIDNLCSGMGTVAFTAFIMSVCDLRFTATQYALLTSFMAQTRYIAGAPSGYLKEALGWETYFLFSAVLALPSLALLFRYKKWGRTASVEDQRQLATAAAAADAD